MGEFAGTYVGAAPVSNGYGDFAAYAARWSASICLSQLVSGFELVKIWPPAPRRWSQDLNQQPTRFANRGGVRLQCRVAR